MASWKMGKYVKCKGFAGYNVGMLSKSSAGDVVTSIPNLAVWTTVVQEKSQTKSRAFDFHIELDHDNSKKNTGSFSLAFSPGSDEDYYKNMSSFAITDTLSEKLRNKKVNWRLSGNENFRLGKKILVLEIGLSRDQIMQQFDISTYRYLNYFMVDSTFSINEQNTNYITGNKFCTAKLVGKSNRVHYNCGLSADASQDYTFNDIVNKSKSNRFSPVSQPVTTNRFTNGKYFGFCEFKSGIFNSGSVSGNFSIGYGNSNLSDLKKTTRNRSLLVTSIIEYHYSISPFKTLTLKMEFGNTQPSPDNFYGHGVLTGIATVMDGAVSIQNVVTKAASVTYQSNNLIANSQLSISGTVRDVAGDYVADYYLIRSFTRTILLPANPHKEALFTLNTEKYFSCVQSKFIFQINAIRQNLNFSVNGIFESNRMTSVRTQFKWLTAFKWPLNLEMSFTDLYASNKVIPRQAHPYSFYLWQYDGYGKLKIEFTKRLYASFLYTYYKLGPNNNYEALDAYLVYKYKKNWRLSLTGHNLTNNRILVQKTISADVISVSSLLLVECYVVGTVSLDL